MLYLGPHGHVQVASGQTPTPPFAPEALVRGGLTWSRAVGVLGPVVSAELGTFVSLGGILALKERNVGILRRERRQLVVQLEGAGLYLFAAFFPGQFLKARVLRLQTSTTHVGEVVYVG